MKKLNLVFALWVIGLIAFPIPANAQMRGHRYYRPLPPPVVMVPSTPLYLVPPPAYYVPSPPFLMPPPVVYYNRPMPNYGRHHGRGYGHHYRR